jgi:hypothetical protein
MGGMHQLEWVLNHLPGYPKSSDIFLVTNFHHFAKILFDQKFLFFEKNYPKNIFKKLKYFSQFPRI